MGELIESTDSGLSCAAGDFFIDPWKPVKRAVITHAHADHAREGAEAILCTRQTHEILKTRFETLPPVQIVEYGERVNLNGVTVSLHPAGHVLGSAQVRVEHRGEVWVFTGDFKRAADPTCAPFEPVRCDALITEATFGLPIYRWDPTELVIEDIRRWWQLNREAGRAAVLFCYTLGKAERILAELAQRTEDPVFIHGSLSAMLEVYRAEGIRMLPTEVVVEQKKGTSFAGALVLAPISARGTVWMRRLGDFRPAFASGWMRLRGPRRQRSFDRGFALSDHADWPALLETVRESGATRVRTTHGYSEQLAHALRDQGVDAVALPTAFQGVSED